VLQYHFAKFFATEQGLSRSLHSDKKFSLATSLQPNRLIISAAAARNHTVFLCLHLTEAAAETAGFPANAKFLSYNIGSSRDRVISYSATPM
jgi:hypothetical protein